MAKHLFPPNTSKPEPFERPPSGGGSDNLPNRDRQQHGSFLFRRLSAIQNQIELSKDKILVPDAIYLDFESAGNSPLAVESIESTRDKRELVAVRTEKRGDQEIQTATVLINPDKLPSFFEKIDQYLKENKSDESDEPKNKKLIESISNIKFSPLKSILTDNYPVEDVNRTIKWEAWLRAGENDDERTEIIDRFKQIAQENGLKTGNKITNFPESTVILVEASFKQISDFIFPHKILSELRRAADTADFFLQLGKQDENDWVIEAKERIVQPADDSPALCILDTGVNFEHPLIRIGLNPNYMDAYNKDWLVTDHDGHGTGMAGLGLYGDLYELFLSAGAVEMKYQLESVKIKPPVGENPPELYGEITKECVARAEIFAPNRDRVICLAITSVIFRNKGIPSSWSASIDSLAACESEEEYKPRLFFVSAGNADQRSYSQYPDSNYVDEIHDPAQAWNALTVGSFTEKTHIDPYSKFGDSKPLAPEGVLSPHSTTSLAWKDEWAIKPDFVMEGGNLALHQSYAEPFEHPSLRLLTTNGDWQKHLIADFGATSASTALASRIGAIILAEYPNLWAETIRGLIVHSATWTPQMLQEFGSNKRNLLRCYGYGIPNLNRALESAKNSLTLIIQDQLIPFKNEGGKTKAHQMHLHEIPWARDILLDLGEIKAEMKVSLSYFIEPNPSSKGYQRKHRYSSHQLKFSTIKSEESRDEFRKRINKAARQNGEQVHDSTGDTTGWFLGDKLRSKGSIHSDTWIGTAADLATKNLLAIYPVGGWWRDLKRQKKWDSVARYSLVVTIKTEKTDIDIYAAIQQQIENTIEIAG